MIKSILAESTPTHFFEKQRTLKEQELTDWIQLINSENIGPVTFYRLLKKWGNAAEALKQLAKKQPVFSRKDAEYELEKASRNNTTILTLGEKAYPENLAGLNDAPPVLYVKGNPALLNYPAAISVVGARNASVNGRKIASKIAFDLTQQQTLVISGMARGIDAAAHKGALYAQNQQGATIAVLGTGVDVPYPAENTTLYEQICAQGAVVSEFLLGTKPQAANFPRRNRLVSALSSGTLVVEASLNSGSLITARMALEQGKDIFAVPGSPLEGRSAGSNKLIREGAVLVENADDILEVLSFTQNRQIKNYTQKQKSAPATPAAGANAKLPLRRKKENDLFAKPLDKAKKTNDIPNQQKNKMQHPLTALIPECGIEADELIRHSDMDAAEVMIGITELELEGVLERINGSFLVLKRKNRKN